MPVHDDQTLADMLTEARVIAVVGFSDKPHRTSHQIGMRLREWGYTVYPVNPTVAEIDGLKAYPSLAAVPEPVDIVNVFRSSEHLPGVVEDAIAAGAKAVWAQIGVSDVGAAHAAEDAGLKMVMDRCIKVDYMRLQPVRA